MRYEVPLTAGRPVRLPHTGKVLQVVDTGVASTVTLDVEWANGAAESYGAVSSKFKLLAALPFSAITLEAGVNCTVDVLISEQDVTVNAFEGTALTATLDPAQLPLPVRVDDTIPIAVETTEDVTAVTATYPAAVAVTAAGQQLMAANAAAKRVTLYNAGPNSVAIYRGAAGAASFATAGIVLPIGGTFIEERFAGTAQAWRAICAAAQTASVQIEVQA